MSRGTTRPIRRRKQSGRPSIFFIVALTIGVALVIWFFVQTLRHPAKRGYLQPASQFVKYRFGVAPS